MQVLEYQHQRRALTLQLKQPLDGVKDAAPSLRRVEGLPLRILYREVEQGEQRSAG
jgi:hypothetical protein